MPKVFDYKCALYEIYIFKPKHLLWFYIWEVIGDREEERQKWRRIKKTGKGEEKTKEKGNTIGFEVKERIANLNP